MTQDSHQADVHELNEVRADPGTPVRAELSLTTPIGRRFSYLATTRSGPDGTARLRLPYATETREPTRPDGPYRVRVGDAELRARVTDAEVRGGAIIPLGGTPTSGLWYSPQFSNLGTWTRRAGSRMGRNRVAIRPDGTCF